MQIKMTHTARAELANAIRHRYRSARGKEKHKILDEFIATTGYHVKFQAAMAIQGYSVAFSEVLARAQRKAPVDTDLILDLYEALFRPSVDAGITDSAALRGWRNSSVGLRGWRCVPPNPKKIPDLIGGLERFAAKEDLSPIARALLAALAAVAPRRSLTRDLQRIAQQLTFEPTGRRTLQVPSPS